MKENSNVLVIGGGIAGISAALDLGENFNVFLVENKASIGGKMAQLDKTFPTLDCSICILAPKMVEVSRHPNITLLTYSEIESLEEIPESGEFKVKIRKKARYVDEDLCTGCGECMEVCPVKMPNEFEAGVLKSKRKAIYIPFAQAIPRKAVIDKNVCIQIKRGTCGKCKEKCLRKAINHEMEDEIIETTVASVVVATGYELMDPKILKRYNYKKYPNVITSMQYERLLSASGPSEGHLVRPSDREKPSNVAFILCAGSRNVKYCAYCSKFCCMYATKDSVLTKEHEPDVDVTVFYNDIRAIGKNHEEFIERAKNEYGVEYIRGIPGDLREDPITKDIIVKHADLITGQVESKPASMVVLCPGVIPSQGATELAQKLGIEQNEFGFFKSRDPLQELESTRPGIYLAGSCQSPDDISNSVAKALGAAALAANRAKPLDETDQPKELTMVEEIPVSSSDTPRIGVFLCHCGINIGGYVDIPEVLEHAKSIEDVTYATANLYTCAMDTQDLIKEKIQEHNLNRIVIAACTPRTHEKLFQETVAEVGLNPYLLTFVSIREMDSWVHMRNPDEATRKAKDLVRMGISRVKLQKPLKSGKTSIEPSALVIGGGVAGMSAALAIAESGIDVYLVEKKNTLGGFLNSIPVVNFERINTQDIIKNLKEKIEKRSNIKIFLNSSVDKINGSIGNFDAMITSQEIEGDFTDIKVGTVIVATGINEAKLNGLMHYGDDPRIITQGELEKKLDEGLDLSGKYVTFIHCVGSREHGGDLGKSYCSLYCCQVSLTNSWRIKEEFPTSNVFVLYRDIRVGTDEEQHYWDARKKINYLRFKEDEYPEVVIEGASKPISVKVHDLITQTRLQIPSDLIVLNMPMLPADENKKISELLKIPLDKDGFFLEAHVKLRPLDFATDGVFLCGGAHGPKNVRESIAQGFGAGSRALTFMLKGEIETEPIRAEVNQDLCISCLECQKVCPFNAISVDFLKGEHKTEVNPALCKGCGTCAATCPAHAITMHHFESEQIMRMVDEALAKPSLDDAHPNIVAFLCNWCSYAGADNAGVSRFQYEPNIRPIRVMCSGRVDEEFILKAFLEGADGVLVAGCHIGDCHYLEGNFATRDRYARLKNQLTQIGIDPRRLRLEWISASEGKMFAELVNEFTNELKSIGVFGNERSKLPQGIKQEEGE
ncbi:MAG: hydrogenase iron-sulfur subunit [Candidatus Hodarchaeota archaeon]